MLRGENADNENESSNNNAELTPNLRFGPSSFHAIPHRMDAENEYLPAATPAATPAAMPAAMPQAASSMGGTRRKRTLRKSCLRNNQRTHRNQRTRRRS